MGCKVSKVFDDGKFENDQIERQLQHQQAARQKETKILMLGTGDSGKSTLLKQLKLITTGGYTHEERGFFKTIIYTNVVQSMQAILEAMNIFQIPFASPATATPHASLIASQRRNITVQDLSPEVFAAIRTLWDDAGVRACFSRCNEFQVTDSAQYYFDSIDRIAEPTFIPADQDILRSRLKTTGVAEFSFTAGTQLYRIIDVGGQRSERKKWMHHFDDVDMVLFLIALSEYDQALYEDGSVNRLQEALDLFNGICRSPWFSRTTVQLVFNKTDLFREKLKTSPLECYFPDFQGGDDYEAARDYIADKFISAGQKRFPDNYLCATDTRQVHMVMGRIIDKL